MNAPHNAENDAGVSMSLSKGHAAENDAPAATSHIDWLIADSDERVCHHNGDEVGHTFNPAAGCGQPPKPCGICVLPPASTQGSDS